MAFMLHLYLLTVVSEYIYMYHEKSKPARFKNTAHKPAIAVGRSPVVQNMRKIVNL